MTWIAIFALAVVLYTVVSRRLGSLSVSAPIIFMALGAVVGLLRVPTELEPGTILTVAEVTLALILFHDAAQVRPRDFVGDRGPLLRLLLIGLPLTIALGWLAATALFPGAGVWVALLVAAALAPTDAGLGAPTVLNPVVPGRVRRLLNGESGLNDGLATPVVLFALAATITPPEQGDIRQAFLAAALEVAGGAAVGAVVGFVAARLLQAARMTGWAEPALAPIGVLVLPLLAYFGASAVHANGFIAAFIAGTAYASVAGAHDEQRLALTDSVSALLAYAVWGLFGLLIVSRIAELATWRDVVFAVLALTVLRIVPVWLALAGTGLASTTRLFVGWFGPRGLASVVFGLIALEQLRGLAPALPMSGVIGTTILLSIVLHGITAGPWAAAYGRWVARARPEEELRA